jgi:hypothetical protein
MAVNIAPHHLDMLAASGIIPEHAARRGYETIRDPQRLAELSRHGVRLRFVL